MKAIRLLISVIFLPLLTFSQEPRLSHYWMDKIGQNPALVGDGVSLDCHFMNRLQWTSLNSKFNTYNFTGDTYIAAPNFTGIGIGLNAQQNQEGDGNLRTQKVETAFSFWKIIGSQMEASVGMSFGFMQKSIENNFAYSDQIDPVLGFIYPTAMKNINSETGRMSYFRFGSVVKVYIGDDYIRKNNTHDLANFVLVGYSRSLNQPRFSFVNNIKYTSPVIETLNASVNMRNGTGTGRSDDWSINQPYVLVQRSSLNGDSYFNSATIGNRFITSDYQCFFGYRFARISDIFESTSNIYKRDAIIAGFGFSPSYFNKSNNFRYSKEKPKMLFHFSIDFTINGITSQETGLTYEGGFILKLPTKWSFDKSIRFQGHRKLKNSCPAY